MQQSSPPSHVIEASTCNKESSCNYYWSCKDPNWEPDLDFPIGLKYGYHVYQCGDPYIHIIFLSGDHAYIQHYLSGEKNQLELMFYVENFSKLGRPITINKCGCRVISLLAELELNKAVNSVNNVVSIKCFC
ncbi:hypothetical protein TSUD_249510 [Trifolium subterraneum]|nr:hypothetical protein TSUD_249510 [Trifolium subterraneum]